MSIYRSCLILLVVCLVVFVLSPQVVEAKNGRAIYLRGTYHTFSGSSVAPGAGAPPAVVPSGGQTGGSSGETVAAEGGSSEGAGSESGDKAETETSEQAGEKRKAAGTRKGGVAAGPKDSIGYFNRNTVDSFKNPSITIYQLASPQGFIGPGSYIPWTEVGASDQ